MDFIDLYESPLGTITLASDGESLVGLWFEQQKYDKATLGACEARPDLPILREARAWLDAYFEGRDPGPIPQVKPRGTEFRQRVWKQLASIPYGSLTTYGEIAQRIAEETGTRASARAVGGGVGHNPISIILPCHRVVGASGSLTGFGGGLPRKIALLELEGIDLSKLSVPTKGTAL
ncbi:methylated-DNA--[protein]-cysteine S-methyltransferase [Raoultibacter phocaeensis]|uniref:methylated-DNA--[protein]-cysteine S-methyltransferase n=1 Tax=Raoultibacter phocaeensis TaxID=2479841 RepID=UPI001117EF1A|nr:methylated-DNA--[protein]-cysteine S-methyltransferase [Raoultibacter phocaeensis]